MYTFTIKDNGPDINVVITRSLLALSAVISLLFRNDSYHALNIIAAIILFATAVFANTLLIKLKVNIRWLLCGAAVVLFVATHSVVFAVILLVYGLLAKKLYKTPVVYINAEGVTIKKMLGKPAHPWGDFNNIILKDRLLTLDFKNNKLLQLDVSESNPIADEYSFNIFCSRFIGV